MTAMLLRAVHTFLALIVFIVGYCKANTGEITFIGKYTGDGKRWAIGIPELEFKYEMDISNTGESILLSWTIGDSVGVNNNKCQYISARGTGWPLDEKPPFFNLTCRVENNSSLITTVALNTSDWEEGLKTIKVKNHGTMQGVFTINITACPVTWDLLQIDATTRGFNDTGKISCQPGTFLFHNGQEKNLAYVVCTSSANWANLSDYSCWFAPRVKILEDLHSTYNAEEDVNFTCSIADGIPTDTRGQLCVAEQNCSSVHSQTFTETINLKPEYNGNYVRCNATNEYSKLNGSSMATSGLLLSVEFGPYKVSVTSANCSETDGGMLNGSLFVEFSSNPSCAQLQFQGKNSYNFVNKSTLGQSCCNVSRQRFKYEFFNVNGEELVEFECVNHTSAPGYLKSTLSALCKPWLEPPPSKSTRTAIFYSTHKIKLVETTTTNTDERGTNAFRPVKTDADVTVGSALSPASLAGIAAGAAVFLLLCIVLLVWMIVKNKKKSESTFDASSANPAFLDSSVPGLGEENLEHQECSNVLYGTADDLKSRSTSGANSREEVHNVLYGTTTSPNSSEVAKTSNQFTELYTTVQKLKKSSGREIDGDSEASTSGLAIDDTYAEVDKGKKKKKKADQVRKDRENPILSGGLQENVTYAAVDKKQKSKGVKSKKTADEPGTSGAMEEATYAAINEKENKPKNGGSDDEDLHGSNVK